MTAYEIAFGVVLIIVSVLIVVFTLSQTQKGQGLSAAIMGDSSFMAVSYTHLTLPTIYSV